MILGDSVRLRAIERSDLPRFVTWLNDPEVLAGLLISIPLSQVHEESWYESNLKRPMSEQILGIEVRQGDDWVLAGTCGFNTIDWTARSGEVGIMIGEKRFWNQGYGSEAMRLLLHFGFDVLNLNRVYLHVHADNPRAVRSYQKVGFVQEGCLRQAVYKNGHYVDVLVMSVLRAERQGGGRP